MARNDEALLQRSILEYLWAVIPQCKVIHYPAGGLRTKREAAKLKWLGVVAGIPDLLIIEPGGKIYGIEVKAPKGRLSPEQEEFKHWCLLNMVPRMTAKSVDHVRSALVQWGIPHREAVSA